MPEPEPEPERAGAAPAGCVPSARVALRVLFGLLLVAACCALAVGAYSAFAAARQADAMQFAFGPQCLFAQRDTWCNAETASSPACTALLWTPLDPGLVRPSEPLASVGLGEARFLVALHARFQVSIGMTDPEQRDRVLSPFNLGGIAWLASAGSNSARPWPRFGLFCDDATRRLFVCVRGTYGKADWESDYAFAAREWPYAGAVGGGGNGNPGAVPMVHGGALRVYCEVRDQLRAALADARGRFDAVTVVGHSLGGSVAAYVAVDIGSLVADPLVAPPRALFVAPMRPGNRAFARLVSQACGGVCASLVNLADVVPAFPPTHVPNAKSVTCCLYEFALVEPVLAFNQPRPDLVACHQLPVHFDAVDPNRPGVVALVPARP